MARWFRRFWRLLMAVPLAIGVAVFLTEMCPGLLRGPLAFLTELLAAIPSVIYGLWAVFVLVPLLREHVNPWLDQDCLAGRASLPTTIPPAWAFSLPAVILAIMILPIISSLTREVMTAVPHSQREAVLALGATRWEMIRMGVLRNARIGIVGAVILGLGRALGETMAVTMVIGNSLEIQRSLLSNGNTMASVIANEFAEAVGDLHLSALMEIGLALFIVTIIVNAFAQLLVWAVTRGAPSRRIEAQRTESRCSVSYAGEEKLNTEHKMRARFRTVDRWRGYRLWRSCPPCWWSRRWSPSSSISSTRAPVRSIWTSSPRFPSRSARPAAAWPMPLSGSAILLGLASLIGVPIGIGGGIFLAEFGRGTKLANAVRFTADVLNGVPSIVMGIAIYALIVVPQGHFSAFSGGVALGIMMIPTVCRTTEEMLLMVPHAVREAALALGVPNWRSVLSITVKTASPGIITGCMLAFARVAGETAPLIFTALRQRVLEHRAQPAHRRSAACRFTSTPSRPTTTGTGWRGRARWC